MSDAYAVVNKAYQAVNRAYSTMKPVANPGPLGLLGFGMTTILLNIHNAGFFPISVMILAMGVFMGGFAQIIAGILEFKKGNTFGMTAFIAYGFFWLTLVAIIMGPKLGLADATPHGFMGWYLAVWGIFSLFMFFGTLKSNRVLQFVFFSLVVLFFLLAVRDWTGSEIIGTIAGYEGIVCGMAALYLAVAEVLNEQYGARVMPIG